MTLSFGIISDTFIAAGCRAIFTLRDRKQRAVVTRDWTLLSSIFPIVFVFLYNVCLEGNNPVNPRFKLQSHYYYIITLGHTINLYQHAALGRTITVLPHLSGGFKQHTI